MAEELTKKAWHHVQGISYGELERAAEQALAQYGDIIELPMPVSEAHPPLPASSRAAQFSPFAALGGFDGMISEAARAAGEAGEGE